MSKSTSFRINDELQNKIDIIKKNNNLQNNSEAIKFAINFYINNNDIKINTEKIKKDINSLKIICRNIEKSSYISKEMINNLMLNSSFDDIILSKNLKSSIYTQAETEYKKDVQKNVIIAINKRKKKK